MRTLDETILRNKRYQQQPDGSWAKPRRDPTGGVASSPIVEPPVRDESVAAIPGENSNSQRYDVCITSYRTRLLDPDNLSGKWFVDCLRHAGIIPDDTAAIVDYSIRQQKVATKAEEHTLVTITPL